MNIKYIGGFKMSSSSKELRIFTNVQIKNKLLEITGYDSTIVVGIYSFEPWSDDEDIMEQAIEITVDRDYDNVITVTKHVE